MERRALSPCKPSPPPDVIHPPQQKSHLQNANMYESPGGRAVSRLVWKHLAARSQCPAGVMPSAASAASASIAGCNIWQRSLAGRRDTGLAECWGYMCRRAGAWSCPTSSWDRFSFICATKDLFHVVGRPVASFSTETPAEVYPNPHTSPKALPLTTLFLACFRHYVCAVSPHTRPYPVPTSTHPCCQHSQFKLFFTYGISAQSLTLTSPHH